MPAKASKKNKNTKKEDMARLSSCFKALSNETRLAVFENVCMGRCEAALDEEGRPSVCCIARNFNISLSTISHHLKELRNVGLIECEKKGQSLFCQPNHETIRIMAEYLLGALKK